jgi:hypothetical protein
MAGSAGMVEQYDISVPSKPTLIGLTPAAEKIITMRFDRKYVVMATQSGKYSKKLVLGKVNSKN